MAIAVVYSGFFFLNSEGIERNSVGSKMTAQIINDSNGIRQLYSAMLLVSQFDATKILTKSRENEPRDNDQLEKESHSVHAAMGLYPLYGEKIRSCHFPVGKKLYPRWAISLLTSVQSFLASLLAMSIVTSTANVRTLHSDESPVASNFAHSRWAL